MRRCLVISALALGLTGCASHAVTPDPASATSLCAGAIPDGHVIGASPTDVQQVRERTGGPGDTSPAAKPWRDLPGQQTAAWCTIRTTNGFIVGAATVGAPFAMFMLSETNPGVLPDGPAIP